MVAPFRTSVVENFFKTRQMANNLSSRLTFPLLLAVPGVPKRVGSIIAQYVLV